MASLERFQQEMEEKILDPVGVHHLLVGGFHGQKVDYEMLGDEDPTYLDGIDLAAERISELSTKNLALAGVANGGNRIARDIAGRIGGPNVYFLDTAKFGDRIRYTKASLIVLRANLINRLVVVDDIGKSGASILQVIRHTWDRADISDVSGFCMVVRREKMEKLDELNIAYDSLVKTIMPDYSPRECAQIGFCKDGWKLIED